MFEAIRAAGGHIGLAFASSAAVFGKPDRHPAGVVADNSPLLPDSFYGVYKVANEGTASVYATGHGIGSIALRPFIVYGLGRDQGMTSDPTKAMLAAAAGVPFQIKFSGSMLLTYAPDCARAFIASARAAAGSGEAISLNVPGHRISVPALAGLIDDVLPGSGRLITWDRNPLPVPSVLAGPAIHDAVGDVPNIPLADGVSETISGFQDALAAGGSRPQCDTYLSRRVSSPATRRRPARNGEHPVKLAALYRGDSGVPALHVAVADGFAAVDDLAAAAGAAELTGLHDVGELFARGPAAAGRLRELASGAQASVEPASARYAPPVLRPTKIICVGLNYADHITESRMERPERIVLFAKFSNALIGHGQPIIRPAFTSQLDYEGLRGGRTSPPQALDTSRPIITFAPRSALHGLKSNRSSGGAGAGSAYASVTGLAPDANRSSSSPSISRPGTGHRPSAGSAWPPGVRCRAAASTRLPNRRPRSTAGSAIRRRAGTRRARWRPGPGRARAAGRHPCWRRRSRRGRARRPRRPRTRPWSRAPGCGPR